MLRSTQVRETGRPAEPIRQTQDGTLAQSLVSHDALTGLPNRSLLEYRFRHAISRADRHYTTPALLMAGLDEFRAINEKLGHAAGNSLLQGVAHRLTRSIRSFDTACRYGENTFAILMPEISHPDTATALAVDIGNHLNEPYRLGNRNIHLGFRIGVAVYPNDGKTFEDMMKQALHNPLLCIVCRGIETDSTIVDATVDAAGPHQATLQAKEAHKAAGTGDGTNHQSFEFA